MLLLFLYFNIAGLNKGISDEINVKIQIFRKRGYLWCVAITAGRRTRREADTAITAGNP
jgi:hypothetical protein